MENLLTVFLDLQVIIVVLSGVFVGIVLSAIPGLTATMGIALLIPFTFTLPPVAGVSMLLGIYVGGMYGSSITAILIRTPGTPSSAATVIDGYPMAVKGDASKALIWSTTSSFFGGLFSCIVLIFLAPQVAKYALSFGPAEYFALAIFGLSIVGAISGSAVMKGITVAALGVFIGTIGMDPIIGQQRMTFGNPNLMSGIAFVPALIGLFAISEVFREMLKTDLAKAIQVKYQKQKVTLKEMFKYRRAFTLSSVIGTIIGVIPGAGATIATFLAYNEVRRFSPKERKKEFGKGAPEGIIASEAANNAVTGGALVPLLTLGIPGDVVTAVILGGLLIQGITPGPLLFQNDQSMIYSIFGTLIMANIFMLILGLLGVRFFARIANVPKHILFPIIMILCLIGSYSISNSLFDVWIALTFGVIGFFLERFKFPLAPLVLGIVLGPMIESNLRRALLSSESGWLVFLEKPICLVFLLIAFLTLIIPLVRSLINAGHGKAMEEFE